MLTQADRSPQASRKLSAAATLYRICWNTRPSRCLSLSSALRPVSLSLSLSGGLRPRHLVTLVTPSFSLLTCPSLSLSLSPSVAISRGTSTDEETSRKLSSPTRLESIGLVELVGVASRNLWGTPKSKVFVSLAYWGRICLFLHRLAVFGVPATPPA
jgi:hypothetical protein